MELRDWWWCQSGRSELQMVKIRNKITDTHCKNGQTIYRHCFDMLMKWPFGLDLLSAYIQSGSYLISVFTPGETLLTFKTTCMRRHNLTTNPKKGRIITMANNWNKHCFAMDADRNKIRIKFAELHYLHLKAEEQELSPLAPWTHWLTCIITSLIWTIVAFSLTHDSQCKEISRLSA